MDHYAAIIDELADQPIVIGHSFGGLITQILLGQGIGRGGRRDGPGGAEGRQARAALKPPGRPPAIAHPSKRRGVVDLDFEQFNYAFTNTWDPADARAGLRTLRRAGDRPHLLRGRARELHARMGRPRSTSTARTADRC